MSLLKFIWGKARKIRSQEGNELIYHPLACHLIDVAAVAESFWEIVLSQNLKDWLNRLLSDELHFAKRIFIFLAGIHDIGKGTPVFQSKVPELAEQLSNLGLDTFSDKPYHGVLSGKIFQELINSDEISLPIKNMELINGLKYVLAGHHGSFPTSIDFSELLPDHLGTGAWKEVHRALANLIAEFSGLNTIPNDISKKLEKLLDWNELNAFLMFLAGFISIVDWIGSNENFFSYFKEFNDVKELKQKYFQISRLKAVDALKKVGWDGWKTIDGAKVMNFTEIFPFVTKLRPLQSETVAKVDTITSPSLIIIEAPMGEGKTEAALYVEHYLETKERLQGAFVALPTQATANQMFQRVTNYLSRIKEGLRVNLHLLHGNAMISDEYQLLKTNSKNFEQESNVVADEWFSYRKRGLISPFGVGTVDQVMLSVLPLKHFFVRLFGLAGKTILIDEVHSYDVYMSTILEELLKWLHFLGASVILLSATLPSNKRKKLIETYTSKTTLINDISYPRITICSNDNVSVSTFETSLQKRGEESVLLEWIEENKVAREIERAIRNGGRAAIICNKVRRAQEFYLQLRDLKDEGIQVKLLHSRYPFYRRKEIEDDVLIKFGSHKDHSKEAQLLISTQIIEQSLDLDFDLMISDLAPVDLLLQRMGRMHRHSRDKKGNVVKRAEGLKRAKLFVIQPELNDLNIPQFSYPIYSLHILLKTYIHLRSIKKISIPDDLEPLIEKVYTKEFRFPNSFTNNKREWKRLLNEAKTKKERKDEKRKLTAQYKLIPNPDNERFFEDFSAYLKESAPEAEIFLNSLTRITNPSITLICLYEEEGCLYLDEKKNLKIDLREKPSFNLAKNILSHSIRVSSYPVFKYFSENKHLVPSWKKNTLIRHIHYMILSKEEKSEKYYFEIPQYRLYLSKELGLLITKL